MGTGGRHLVQVTVGSCGLEWGGDTWQGAQWGAGGRALKWGDISKDTRELRGRWKVAKGGRRSRGDGRGAGS